MCATPGRTMRACRIAKKWIVGCRPCASAAMPYEPCFSPFGPRFKSAKPVRDENPYHWTTTDARATDSIAGNRTRVFRVRCMEVRHSDGPRRLAPPDGQAPARDAPGRTFAPPDSTSSPRLPLPRERDVRPVLPAVVPRRLRRRQNPSKNATVDGRHTQDQGSIPCREAAAGW